MMRSTLHMKQLFPRHQPLSRFLRPVTVRHTVTRQPALRFSSSTVSTSNAQSEPAPKNKETLQRILTPTQNNLLQQEKELLLSFQTLLSKLKPEEHDVQLLEQSIKHLEELFLLVVAGEFNSGKSSLVNTLLGGGKHLKEGITPTTSKITLIKYGEQVSQTSRSSSLDEFTFPIEWLKEINVVDTPGTNSIVHGHQQITEEFIPRADIILLLMSADRAFSESEKAFLSKIKTFAKKVVLVITKKDLVEEENDLKELQKFVLRKFQENFGASEVAENTPTIFEVSSRLANKARKTSSTPAELENSPLWLASNFGQLQSFIHQKLTSEERAKLKLKNPLGVALQLQAKYLTILKERKSTLEVDWEVISTIDRQLKIFNEELKQDLDLRQARLDRDLLELENKGYIFIDEQLTLTNTLSLMQPNKLQQKFHSEVLEPLTRQMEANISELVDWIVAKFHNQSHHVIDHVTQRVQRFPSGTLIGRVESKFDFDRRETLNSVSLKAKEVFSSFDKQKESLILAQALREAIVQTAVVEVGAIGIGALIIPALLDISGIFSAGALAALGLVVLPYKKSQLKSELRGRLGLLSNRLRDTLKVHFSNDISDSVSRIESSISPYTLFVKSEIQSITSQMDSVAHYQSKLNDISAQIDSTFTKV